MVIGRVSTYPGTRYAYQKVSLVKENPPVRPKKKSTNGKKPVYLWEKLVCICILMVVFGSTYRNIQNVVPSLNLPWNEPYPDHTWI
ncbi:MAG: hypothetical protein WA323_22470, partial [Candidatus Nitrosopolaris sp.]